MMFLKEYVARAYQAYKNYPVFDNPDDTRLRSFTVAEPVVQNTCTQTYFKQVLPGVFVMSIQEFFTRYPDDATLYDCAAQHIWTHRQVYAYADAFAAHSLVVYVQPSTIVQDSISLQTLCATLDGCYHAYKIIIGDRAHITIDDTCTPPDHKDVYVRTVTYYVGKQATLSLVHDLKIHQTHSLSSAIFFVCQTYATVTVHAILAAGPKTHCWFDLLMQGPESTITVRGIAIAQGNNHTISIISEQRHLAPHTTADLSISAVVAHNAFVSYHGRIHTAVSGQHTESKQRNQVLLLTDKAHAVSIPSLEALAHQIHCVHATAMGTVDPHQVQYLQSRGLSYEQARTLILQGFLQVSVGTSPQTNPLVARALEYLRFKNPLP